MKYIRLAIISLKSSIRQEKFLALWTFFGIVMASFMIIIMSRWYFEKSEDRAYEHFISDRVELMYDHNPANDELWSYLQENEMVENFSVSYISSEGARITAWKNPNSAQIYFEGGRLFGEDAGEECVISSKYQLDLNMQDNKAVIGDQIRIKDDISFVCTGISIAGNFDILIPLKEFKEIIESSDINDPSIVIIFLYDSSEIEREKINSDIIDISAPAFIVRNEKPARFTMFSFISDNIGALLLTVFMILNYIIVYNQWLEKRSYTFNIFKICGLSSGKAITLILMEQATLLILFHLIAFILYWSFDLFIRSDADRFPYLTHYCFTVVVIAAIGAVIFVFNSIRNHRRGMLDSLRTGALH